MPVDVSDRFMLKYTVMFKHTENMQYSNMYGIPWKGVCVKVGHATMG